MKNIKKINFLGYQIKEKKILICDCNIAIAICKKIKKSNCHHSSIDNFFKTYINFKKKKKKGKLLAVDFFCPIQ